MTDHSIYVFGQFRLDPAEHLLLCEGTPVPLTEKAFQVLLVLARNSGHLIEKSELVAAVWGDTFIEEGNLTVTISMLRKALGDDRSEKRFIETVSKQGYRFLPAVSRIAVLAPRPEAIAETPAGITSTLLAPANSGWLPGGRRVSFAISGLAALSVIFLVQARVHASRSTGDSLSPSSAVAALPVANREQLAKPVAVIRDPEAYQLYIEGRYFWNKRTEDGFRHSIECFQRAILKDPTYAAAYAGLADSYTLLASYGVEPPAEAYPNARAAATKALQLDNKLAEAHTSLGLVALYYEWDWQQADREFKRAIELDPGLSGAHVWDSLYYAVMGQTPQALQQALYAEQLDPLSLAVNMDLGSAYYWNRQFDKAVGAYKRAIALDPYFARAHSRLGIVLAAEKDYAGAVREFQETSRLAGPDPYIEGLTGYAEALGGNPKVARKLLADLKQRTHTQYVPAFSLALLYLGIGDRNQAMTWLERSCQDRSTYMIFAKVDPLLDPLRSDQRFDSLLRQMDLRELAAENDPARKPVALQP
jgi:DNA-binding winged helix-turn-helix (wHTH) protein/tetratricopeptide (TPR) repeat protein